MKKIRNATLLLIVITLLFSNVFAATMYAPDGRMAEISEAEIMDYKNVGWYDYPVVTMYASDGRAIVVNKSSVSDWESVGWIDGSKTTTVYAADGRTATIPLWQLQSYKDVGWYDYPVATMYASDGRAIVVNKSSVSDWESVGWIDGSKTITVYAADGRTATIPLWQLQSYKDVGWYDRPVTPIYYPNTNLLTYEYVTGAKPYYNVGTIEGFIVYNYIFDQIAVRKYIDYLQSNGWEYVKADTEAETGAAVTYYYKKSSYVAVAVFTDPFVTGKMGIGVMK